MRDNFYLLMFLSLGCVICLSTCKKSDNMDDDDPGPTEDKLISNNISDSWKTYNYSPWLQGIASRTPGLVNFSLVRSKEMALEYLALPVNDLLGVTARTHWSDRNLDQSFHNVLYQVGPDKFDDDEPPFSFRLTKFMHPIGDGYHVKAERFVDLVNPAEYRNIERANQGRGLKFTKRFPELKGENVSVLHLTNTSKFVDVANETYESVLVRLDEVYFRQNTYDIHNYYNIVINYQDYCTFGQNQAVMALQCQGRFVNPDTLVQVVNETQLTFKNLATGELKVVPFPGSTYRSFTNVKLESLGDNGLAYTTKDDGLSHEVYHFTSSGNELKSTHSFTTTEEMTPAAFFSDEDHFYLFLTKRTYVDREYHVNIKGFRYSSDGTSTDLGEVQLDLGLTEDKISCEVYKGEVFIAYQDKETEFPVVKKWINSQLQVVGSEPFTKTKSSIDLISRGGKLFAFIRNDLNEIHQPPCCSTGFVYEVLLYQD